MPKPAAICKNLRRVTLMDVQMNGCSKLNGRVPPRQIDTAEGVNCQNWNFGFGLPSHDSPLTRIPGIPIVNFAGKGHAASISNRK
jgi:hypothetical protein